MGAGRCRSWSRSPVATAGNSRRSLRGRAAASFKVGGKGVVSELVCVKDFFEAKATHSTGKGVQLPWLGSSLFPVPGSHLSHSPLAQQISKPPTSRQMGVVDRCELFDFGGAFESWGTVTHDMYCIH